MNDYSQAAANIFADLASQQHPPQTLYLVATPIGNTADISLRALWLLAHCEAIACEDSRKSKSLLQHYGFDPQRYRWISSHQHNEREGATEIVAALKQGCRVALLCDAGTPGISDPGARVVDSVVTAGFRVVPIPGASALSALLSVTGIQGEFTFLGFLPAKGRQQSLKKYQAMGGNLLLFEAPHRIHALVSDIKTMFPGNSQIVIGRELTKQFETVYRAQVKDLLEADLPERGEYALLLAPPPPASSTTEGERVLRLLLPALPLTQAVQLTSQITAGRKNDLYQLALALQAEIGEKPGEGL